MAVQYFLICDLELCGDNFSWKCVVCSFVLMVGGHAMLAISGSRRWYLLRYVDAAFLLKSKRSVIDGWSVVGSTSILGLKP